jgi:mono/diheme cytochrome c family protein
MPAFEGKLGDDEIKAVIIYLKTLWGPSERQFQAEVSKQDPFP